MEVQIANPQDVDLMFPTLKQLRPHLNRDNIIEDLIDQFKEGYQLVFIGDQGEVFALAGFRTINFLFSGKTLYIDDLVTNSNHKRKGYAAMLFEWITKYAKENNYDHISLDSGFQRKDAYRFYLNKGLEVESLHFGRKVMDL